MPATPQSAVYQPITGRIRGKLFESFEELLNDSWSQDGYMDRHGDSKIRVTGPSFTSETFISA
jgi:hypothetical protein